MINTKHLLCSYFFVVLIILPIVHCSSPKKLSALTKPDVQTSVIINQPVQDTLPEQLADKSTQKPDLPPCQEPTNDSVNEYNYPFITVNVSQIAAILKSRNYSAIESVYVDVQNKFEKDFRNEFCLFDAYQMCIAAQPGMLSILEEWQKAYPSSANPLVALAKYYYEAGFDARGEKIRSKTRQGQIDTMKQYFNIAMKYIDKALEINPKCYGCYLYKMEITMATGEREANIAAFNSAIQINPYAAKAWISFLNCISPQWGGSYEIMQEIVDKSSIFKECNPFLAVLQGCIYCNLGELAEDNNEAVQYFSKAIQCARYPYFFRNRADRYQALEKYQAALCDMDSAIALQPEHAYNHLRRAEILYFSAIKSGRAKKLEYFKRCLKDYSFASKIIPKYPDVAKWRRFYDTLSRISQRGNPTELAVIGNWYIWKEKRSDGSLHYYTVDDHQQIRAISFTESKDIFIENGQVVHICVKYKWENGYFLTLYDMTNKYDYRYKVSFKDDMLFMSEIDWNGNAVTEDVYKPYPYSMPPKWGK
jgi:tetratricopeptide (TPR) repeat protein